MTVAFLPLPSFAFAVSVTTPVLPLPLGCTVTVPSPLSRKTATFFLFLSAIDQLTPCPASSGRTEAAKRSSARPLRLRSKMTVLPVTVTPASSVTTTLCALG